MFSVVLFALHDFLLPNSGKMYGLDVITVIILKSSINKSQNLKRAFFKRQDKKEDFTFKDADPQLRSQPLSTFLKNTDSVIGRGTNFSPLEEEEDEERLIFSSSSSSSSFYLGPFFSFFLGAESGGKRRCLTSCLLFLL